MTKTEFVPRRQLDGDGIHDTVSISSGAQMSSLFFGGEPTHTNSHTWKSQQAKDRQRYERIHHAVRHIAPEQFRDVAKPTSEPCEIMPKSFQEWQEHRKHLLVMASEQNERNIAAMKAKVMAKNADARIAVKSKLGVDPSGKELVYGFGPVLCQPTIWSKEYTKLGRPQAKWPSVAELQWNGDQRENSQAKTRCGRYLPPPREPSAGAQPFQDQAFIRPLPLDETGPVFAAGPTPMEIYPNNVEMDTDLAFEGQARTYLGKGLMEELGNWQAPFVPAWQALQRHAREMHSGPFQLHEQYAMWNAIDSMF